MLGAFVRSKEFTQLYLPVIVIAAIGLVMAGILAFLIIQQISA